MKKSKSFAVAIVVLFLVFFTFLDSVIASAYTCKSLFVKNQPTTVRQLIQKSSQQIQEKHKTTPKPQFADIQIERQREDSGEKGPRVFEEFLPEGVQYFKVPSPNAEHIAVAGRINPLGGYALRLTLPWKFGKQVVNTTTPLYAWVPKNLRAQPSSNFLMSSSAEFVVWHIHGGGTSTAEAMNASSKANYFMKRGVPVMAITQPGHGDATRAPFSSAKEILLWNLRAIRQIVPPNVKVILSGHSWGGEFALHAAREINKPEFDQIAGIISESPPIDASLGKGLNAKLEFEKALEAKIQSEIENLNHGQNDNNSLLSRISPADITFLANHIESGKLSPVATWFTTITFMDHSFQILPKAERSQMKPVMVLMNRMDFVL